VTYLIEYLSKLKFIFETVLGYVSGDQMGSFEAKKTESKISRLGTFKGYTLSSYNQGELPVSNPLRSDGGSRGRFDSLSNFIFI
jgi:hypothetical protein